MKAACGKVFKYGDNVDTDVIIPARYLNSSDPKELAQHCMEDIDADFVKKVSPGDLIVADKEFRLRLLQRARAAGHQGGRGKLCDRGDFCPDFLPQRHQYRTAHHRVSGGGEGHRRRRRGGSGF